MARRHPLWLLFAAIIVVGASYAVWQRTRPPVETPLERDWTAVVAVLAGDGVAGLRDAEADRARFSEPFGVASAPDGTVYVADAGVAQRIRRIAPAGTVSTLAGGERGYVDGDATVARFDTPSGLAIDAVGTLYVADTGNNVIRRINAHGVVSTIAGDGTAGYRDGPARDARFNGPVGVAVDARGRVIVADTYNDRIRAIHPDGTVTTVAGSGESGWSDGASGVAQFDTPCGVAVDAAFNIYVADTGNHAVRRISPDGIVSTVGPGPVTGLFHPIGIAVDDGGLIYVGDAARIVEIRPGTHAHTVAGSRPGFADGSGRDARFRTVAGVAVASPGRLIVTDSVNALVRLVAAGSRIEMRLPASPWIDPAFDAATFNLLPLLWPFDDLASPFEITGTMGEARGGTGGERFHAGLDVGGDEGMMVFALRDGVVSSPLAVSAFGTSSESIRIGPIAYVHLRVGRYRGDAVFDLSKFVPSYDETGRLRRLRVKRGARFSTGEPVGTLNAFNHAHLNIGWPGEEHNPLLFRLVQFEDTVPPTIAPDGVRLFGEDGQPITRRERRRLAVDGRVQVVVDAWDQVDGNEARRRLGVYTVGYQVLDPDGSPAAGFETPRETIVFDRLSPDEEAPGLVFASGSGIPYYGTRRTRFLYVATNTFRNGIASPGYWDTSTLAPGDYTLRVLVGDIRGNVALRNRDLPVTITREDATPAAP
jgi:sugar lactone lactonase YvrE